MNKERIAQCEDALRRSREFIALDILEQLERENIELKLLSGKMKSLINQFIELEEENEQLKKQISYLEDNLRVARKDREDLRNDIANGLKEFTKELLFTSLRLLANEELKDENEQLKEQIEKTKCCHSCKSHKEDTFKKCQTCDTNYSNWELAE